MKLSVVIMAAAMLALTACSQESKVRSAVKNQVEEKIKMGVAKDFKGAEKSKVWMDLKELHASKTSVEVGDVKIDGDSANGSLKVTSLADDTTAGLVMILMLASSDLDKKGLGLKDAWEDLRKEDKRMPAMADYPLETKEYTFTAAKEDGWKLKDFKPVKKQNKQVKK